MGNRLKQLVLRGELAPFAARLRANKRASAVIIAGALLLFLTAVAQVLGALRPSALFPKADQRLDLTELHVARLADVCPDAARELSGAAFEACVADLPAHPSAKGAFGFTRVKIPTLEKIWDDGHPMFRDLLSEQAPKELTRAFQKREPYLIGLEIPGVYLSPDRLGQPYYSLVFNGMQDGRICIDGACRYVVSMYDYTALSFPLLADATPEGKATIWIFGKDVSFPLGMLLADGVFIAKSGDLVAMNRIYKSLRQIRSIFHFCLFAGLFLLAIGFAVLWPGFPDYAAFLFLAASVSNVMLSDYIFVWNFTYDMETFNRVRTWALGNFAVAAIVMALAVVRASGKRIVATLFIGQLLAVLGAFAAPSVMDEYVPFHSRFVPVLCGVVGSVTVLMLVSGATSCLILLRKAATGGAPLSERLDLRRRMYEQMVHVVLLAVLIESIRTFKYSQNETTANYAVVVGCVALFGSLLALLYHSTVRIARTHFDRAGFSEAANLQTRLSREAYSSWLVQKRSGIMLQVDLRNSSRATALDGRIHALMNDLSDRLRASYRDRGYYWILAKRNGDEWLFVLSRKSRDLSDDLVEVAAIAACDADAWRAIVQQYAAECSLHLHLYALKSYTLREPAGVRAVERGAVESDGGVLDFASKEANFLMKYLGKAAGDDLLTIGAAHDLLGPALLGQAQRAGPLGELVREKTGDPETMAAIEGLELWYACVSMTGSRAVVERRAS